jgi:hypothetical protein
MKAAFITDFPDDDAGTRDVNHVDEEKAAKCDCSDSSLNLMSRVLCIIVLEFSSK